MARFLATRMALLAATLLVASIAIWGTLSLAPGDPVAVLTGGRQVGPEARAELMARYHLDEPLPVRYWHWLTSALRGDLGYSLVDRQDVATLVAQRAGTTLALLGLTAVIVVVVGGALGTLAALRPGTVDNAVVVTATVLAAVPSFVTALVLISVFAVTLGWLPALGEGSGVVDQLRHLLLPSIALACTSLALVARVTRASVRAELPREHVQTAISRGLPRRAVLRRHVFRNAAVPVTTVSGLTIASLIVLVAIVEEVFDLNGLGAALVSAAQSKDFAVVQAVALLMVTAFVVINVVVDLLYALLDPRVGLGTAAR